MYTISNFVNNDDIKVLDRMGAFQVIEYQRDLSVMPGDAQLAYYCNAMNVRKRQVLCNVAMSPVTVQAGAMQWTVGNVNATTGVKGCGAASPANLPSSPSIPATACWFWSRLTSTSC